MGHDRSRDRLEVGAETPLCLEALAKRRGDKGLTEPGDDAAANIDTAPRTEGQRQVTGHRAEHSAEYGERLDTERIRGAGRQIGDLGRRISARRDTVELR